MIDIFPALTIASHRKSLYLPSDTDFSWACQRKGGSIIAGERCQQIYQAGRKGCGRCKNRKKRIHFVPDKTGTSKEPDTSLWQRRIDADSEDELKHICAYSQLPEAIDYCPRETTFAQLRKGCLDRRYFDSTNFCIHEDAGKNNPHNCIHSSVKPRKKCPNFSSKCEGSNGICRAKR